MAKYKILTPEREALLVQTLAPQFLGRQQDHLLAFADEVADVAFDEAAEQIQPLVQFREDIQSPQGAEMIGITDAGNYFGGTGNIEDALQNAGAQIQAITGVDLSDYATLLDPIFVGNPTAPTPATADNDTSIATTAFVKAQGYAPLASPVFTGDPQAPTPALADNDTSIATTAWVKAQGYSSGAGSGSVTSVGLTGSTGLTIGGTNPVTSSGTITATLSANLQSWSGITPATKADDADVIHKDSTTETKTGILAANLAHRIDGGYFTLGSYSTATYGSGSCRIWWNENLKQVTFTDATDLMLSGGVAVAKANEVMTLGTNQTVTSSKVFNTAIGFGAALAPGGATDLSRHINLHTAGYGFSITTSNLNIVSGSSITFYNNGASTVNIDAAGTLDYKGNEVGWRNLNRVTSGVSAGQMYATTGGFTVGTGSAAGLTLYVYNNSASAITLTQGAGVTLRLAGTATTGNRTLAPRGFATLWYNTTAEVICSGDVT